MKKTLCIFLILFQSIILYSQNEEITSNETATVYFVRASGLGALINFTFFDGEKVIGKFNGPKYMKYECAPGEHLFWARSENRSFVEANLVAGKIYLIDVVPRMGGLKASVKLVPVDKNDYKMKHIQKLVTKKDPQVFSETELNEFQMNAVEIIVRGMEKYHEDKAKEKDILMLKPEMTITEEDLVFSKK